MKTENLNVIVILMRHNADPSLANKDNQTPLELAESKNRLDILDVLRKTSPLLQNSDESLSQGSQSERIEDIDDIESIEIPEQTSPTDPYSRYKNPEKVLKKLGRSSFEELPEHLNMDMLRRLQEPKVKEVKSKRLTPAERKKKKWTVTTAGEEQKKMQEKRANSSQNDKIDTDSLLEEAEQAALKEQEEQKMKNQKKKKSAPPPPPSSSTTSSQKFVPKEEPLPKEKESDTESEKPIKTKEEKQSPKQKKVESQKPVEKSEPPKKPQNRGKKIKKDLKRVQSSSTSSDNSEDDEDDDEIIVMPSFQNKPQQSKSHTKSEQPPETPSIQENQPQNQPQQPLQPSQQPLQQQQQPSNQAESSFSLDQLKKFMDGYLSERQSQSQPQQPQQPQVHYALPPGAYFVPAPGINQPIAIPTMPQMQQIPAYNPMQPYLGVGNLPMGMKLPNQLPQQQPQAGMNVTRSEMQKLEARIASLEQIFAPAMRQFQMVGPMSSQIQLGTCQNCKTLNATSVCPRCGIQLCNGCRDIHNNQRCK